MPIGPLMRRLLGPIEPRVATAYRRFFIDLGALARTVQRLAPARDILEIGAGDGFLAMELLAANPGSGYVGIDVAAGVGRLFTGDRSAVSFHAMPLSDMDADLSFDLVVFSDVLHHVAPAERQDLIGLAWGHVRPGGYLAIKEWERRRNLPHFFAFASDRYISGDRGVSFLTRTDLLRLLSDSLDAPGAISSARIHPRHNNLLVVIQKPGAAVA